MREVCPACRAPALVETTTIHHYPCAHVGLEEEFRAADHLICPKCGVQLRHIGVDYERVEAELECERCREAWSDAEVAVRCLECGDDRPVAEARVVTVRRYRATAELRRAAERPWSPLHAPHRLLEAALDSLDPAVFAVIERHSARLARRYGRPASVVRLTLIDPHRTHDVLGRASFRRALGEVASRIREAIRDTDVLTVDGSDIEVLLAETPLDRAGEVGKRLVRAVGEATGGQLRCRFEARALEADDE